MDTFSKAQVFERASHLSEAINDALVDITNGDLIWAICEAQHLNEEKIGTVAKIVGYIFFGLVHKEDLGKEIAENVGIDRKLADDIAREIDQKIFSRYRNELENAFNPSIQVGASATEEELHEEVTEAPALVSAVRNMDREENFVQIERLGHAEPQEIKPFILHEEKSATEERKPSKKFSLPLGFFSRGEKTQEPTTQVKARVEKLLGEKKEESPAKQKVVHYSEYRSAPSAFSRGEEPITFEPSPEPAQVRRVPTPPIVPSQQNFTKTNPEEGVGETPFKEKRGPSVEGNTIDLSKI